MHILKQIWLLYVFYQIGERWMDLKICHDLLDGEAYMDPAIYLPPTSSFVGQMTQVIDRL